MIPVYEPYLDSSEMHNLVNAVNSTWISSKGEYLEKFKIALETFTKIPNCILTSNGTTALQAVADISEHNDKSKIAIPAFTYVASATPFIKNRCQILFMDVDFETWMPSPETTEKFLDYDLTSFLTVDMYGKPVTSEICEKLKNSEIIWINDGAESLGSTMSQKHVGIDADFHTLSFFGNKIITTGEGGAFFAKNPNNYEKGLKIINQGLSLDLEYWHDQLGFNYRMTNLAAAIGVAQMEKIEEILRKKRNIYNLYKSLLDSQKFTFQKVESESVSNNWMIATLVQTNESRDATRKFLRNHEIETRPFFAPIPMMPFLSKPNTKFQVSIDLWKRGIIFPSSPNLSEEQIYQICDLANSVA